MFDESLPADLQQMERDIGPMMRFDVEPAFGQRIAFAVRGELRRGRSAGRWKFALALAACAMLWIHVSFYAASSTDFHFRPAGSYDNHQVMYRLGGEYQKGTEN